MESSTLYGTVSQRDELGQTSVLSAPPPLAMHWADRATGRVLARTKMFDAGFGDVSALERMRDDHELFGAAPDVPLEAALAHAVSLPQVPGLRPRATEGIALRELSWHSEAVDPRFEAPVRRARALLLVGGRSPANTTTLDPSTPLCIAMAASGEEGYARRAKVLAPLVRAGLDALVLENPFYGARRRPGQRSARLPTVYEQFHMNHASVLEALGLLRGLRALPGMANKPLGLLGYSMGGFMVCLAASAFESPLALVPVAAGRSPRSVYLDGALSWAVDFRSLERERADARVFLGDLFESTARHLRPPVDGSSVVLTAAERDGFVFPGETDQLLREWPGASLRRYRGGHTHVFTAFDGHVRRAVRDAFAELAC
ncbi:MAG: alpha/beta hydrolase family protein [Myxococcales bacterium]|nr:alpha/beta hydrolase family protein [Myxococcales bacterium]